MKTAVKRILQRLLGFEKYLRVFARYKIKTLHNDKNERDFFLFMQQVKDEGVVLDIGANLGIMTWHMIKHFQNAEVWAFEPIEENLGVLREMVKDAGSDRVQIFDFALGSEEGVAEMVMPEEDAVRLQGLSHMKHESIDTFNTGKDYKVKVKRLSDVIPASAHVTGIKLDVENFEYFVLLGGKEVLEKDKPVVYTELWDNENRQKVLEFMRNLGYDTLVASGDKLIPFEAGKYDGQNFFFLDHAS